MANISKVTELDFTTIKQNLKSYFNRPNSPFRDWDFEGSGLNYLLDILAYNTHYNAVNAHLSMNESFLDSAQIRSNAVSRAKAISYTPRSRRGARAVLNLTFTRRAGSSEEILTLPRGTTFSTTIDGKAYTFSTREDYETVFNTERQLFVFDNVTVVQGTLTTRAFIVDSAVVNQRFKIDDENIDTSTIEVVVTKHSASTEEETYLNGDLFTSYDSQTLAYFLSENYEGKYQIEFGDGIIGKKLDNLNVVKVSFLSSAGDFANGARQFRFIRAPVDTPFASIAALSTLTVAQTAYGGDERESTEAIRLVAPNAFIAQNRTVTVNDFEALIKKNIPDVDAISVWGGQDNEPPVYGHVFISIKPKSAYFLTQSQKDEVLSYLNRVKILTIKPQIVDADYIFLYFDVFFKYNPNRTTLSRTQLESIVRQEIINFNTESLGGFDKIYRYSKFLSTIDSADPSILNSNARIYVYKTLPLYAVNALPSTLDFKLRPYGEVDQPEPMLISTGWKYNNESVYLSDEPIDGSSTERSVYIYKLSRDLKTQIRVFSDVGRFNVTTGVLSLNSIPSTFDTQIQVKIIPDSFDIATIRNQLITIDIAQTLVVGDIDDTLNTGAVDRSYDTVSRFRENVKLR